MRRAEPGVPRVPPESGPAPSLETRKMPALADAAPHQPLRRPFLSAAAVPPVPHTAGIRAGKRRGAIGGPRGSAGGRAPKNARLHNCSFKCLAPRSRP